MWKETTSILVILSIAILFLNPGHLTMPMSTVSMLTIGLVVAFLSFAAFVIKEQSSDEREAIHLSQAGRVAYLAGIAMLLIGIIIQTFNHHVDPWLVYTVCTMLVTKLMSRLYFEHKM